MEKEDCMADETSVDSKRVGMVVVATCVVGRGADGKAGTVTLGTLRVMADTLDEHSMVAAGREDKGGTTVAGERDCNDADSLVARKKARAKAGGAGAYVVLGRIPARLPDPDEEVSTIDAVG
jgi:hypothetical protein